jgi:hypothetical protein
MRLTDVLDVRVARLELRHHGSRAVSRSVVADDDLQFFARIRLGKQRMQTDLEELSAVVRQNDDRKCRHDANVP